MGRFSAPRRRRGESGFTLVEMMMSLLLLGIVMIPLSEVFINGTRVDATTGQRTSAEQIATRALEAIRAVPYNAVVAPNSYDMVGFYSDESFPPGYSSWYAHPTWNNNSSGTNPAGPLTQIVLGSCSTTCATPFTPPLQPQSTCPAPAGQAASDCPAGVSYAGTVYTITRYLYWLSSSGYQYTSSSSTATTFSQAYKGLTVVVTWHDASGSHTVQQDSVLYPGGLGVCSTPTNCNAPATTTSTTIASPPTQPTLTVTSTGQTTVSLSWATPAGSPTGYQLAYSTSSSMTNPQILTPSPTAMTTSATVSGLAPVTYWFTLTAMNSAGSSAPSNPVSATPTGTTTTSSTSTATTTTSTTTVPSSSSTTTGTTTTTSSSTTTSTTTPACQVSSLTVSPAKIYLTKDTGQGAGANASTTTLSGSFLVTANVSSTCSSVLQVTSAGNTTPTKADPGSPYLLTSPGGSGVGTWTYSLPTSYLTGWSQDTHVMRLTIGGSSTTTTANLLVCGYKPPGQQTTSTTSC